MSEKIPISAVLITKNAINELAACLDSVNFCGEILVVDSGSDDGTAEFAKSKGACVIQSSWRGFGPQKQFAVEQASYDWVLCVDADERVTEPLRQSLLTAVSVATPDAEMSSSATSGGPIVAYRFARCNRFMGRYLRHGEGYPDWTLRFFDRRAARWSDDTVHEKVIVDRGRIGTLGGDLLHESAESLDNYFAKQNRYSTLAAHAALARGKHANVLQAVGSPVMRFIKFYFFRLGFLDGAAGLVHVMIGCVASFSKYAKMLAEQRKANQ